MNTEKYMDQLGTLLAFYERENKFRKVFLSKELKSTIALSNIEYDVLKFMAKSGKSKKSDDRINDVNDLRDFIEYSNVIFMRHEALILSMDYLRDAALVLQEENKKLKKDLEDVTNAINGI